MAEQQTIIDALIEHIDKAILKGSVTNEQVAAILDFLNEAQKGALRKDIQDTAAELIAFLKGINVTGGATVDYMHVLETLSAKLVDAAKVSSTDVEVTNTASTLNLIVRQLASLYDLSVENVATLFRTVIKESVSSDSFVSGLAGSGMKIYKAINGDWNMEIDNLTVRKIFSVFELVVQKITHQGGMVIRSAAGGKLTKVTDGGSYWRCEHDSTNDFVADDQVLCQTFTGTTIKRYWRLVTSAGTGYFNLSKADCEANSASPEQDDEVAVLGNRTVTARQSAQIDCAVGDTAPYRDDYEGINSYSLDGKLITRVGNLSGIVDAVFGTLSGSGLYGKNVRLKGDFVLESTGKSVSKEFDDVRTAFEIREGVISSKVTQATTSAAKASVSETNATKAAGTASGKASEASQSATNASNSAGASSASAAQSASSASSAKNSADVAADKLTTITQKETSINQTAKAIELKATDVTTTAAQAASSASAAASSAATAGSKANEAASSAASALDSLARVTVKETSITQTAGAIELKATRAETAAGRAESAEAAINVKADGIVMQVSSAAAQKAVDSVQIGGRNLMTHTKDIQSFVSKYGYGGSDYGNNTYIIENNYYKNTVIANGNANNYHFIETGLPDLVRGQYYTFSVDVKTNNDRGILNFMPNYPSEGSNVVTIPNTNGAWHRISVSVLINNPLTSSSLFDIRFTPGVAGDYVCYKNIKLEKGNKATDWTPAPEDVDNLITTAQTTANNALSAANGAVPLTTYNSKIEQLDRSISAKAEQTTVNDLTSRVSSAEAKITPESINLTVKSQINSAVNSIGKLYVRGTGLNNNATPSVCINNSEYVNSYGRGHTLITINRSDLSKSEIITYDTYGDSGYCDNLASKLNSLSTNIIVILVSYDACAINSNLANAIQRCGGSGKTFAADRIPYAFVGIPCIGAGNGIEVICGNGSSDPYAQFSSTITNGMPQGVMSAIGIYEQIKSSISITTNGINILGKSLSLTGAVTFSSLDSDSQSRVNNAQSTATNAANAASSAQGTANSAVSAASNAQTTADTAARNLTSLQNSLGAMAYQNMVSLARLDSTVVEGGFIKTSLINADAIITNQLLANKIAATDITTNRLAVTSGAKIGAFAVTDGLSYDNGSDSLIIGPMNGRIVTYDPYVDQANTAVNIMQFSKSDMTNSLNRSNFTIGKTTHLGRAAFTKRGTTMNSADAQASTVIINGGLYLDKMAIDVDYGYQEITDINQLNSITYNSPRRFIIGLKLTSSQSLTWAFLNSLSGDNGFGIMYTFIHLSGAQLAVQTYGGTVYLNKPDKSITILSLKSYKNQSETRWVPITQAAWW